MSIRSLAVIIEQSLGRCSVLADTAPSPPEGHSTRLLHQGTRASAGHQRGLRVATSEDLNWPSAGTFSWPRTAGQLDVGAFAVEAVAGPLDGVPFEADRDARRHPAMRSGQDPPD